MRQLKFLLLLIFASKNVTAQTAGPNEATIRRLEEKLATVCLTLPKDEPPYLSRLSKAEIGVSCKCAVPNAVKEIVDENVRDGGAAYYKVAAHMMICNESRLKSKFIKEKLPMEISLEKKYSYQKTTEERVNCLVNQEFEFYLDAYQTMKTPDEKVIFEVVKNCRR